MRYVAGSTAATLSAGSRSTTCAERDRLDVGDARQPPDRRDGAVVEGLGAGDDDVGVPTRRCAGPGASTACAGSRVGPLDGEPAEPDGRSASSGRVLEPGSVGSSSAPSPDPSQPAVRVAARSAATTSERAHGVRVPWRSLLPDPPTSPSKGRRAAPRVRRSRRPEHRFAGQVGRLVDPGQVRAAAEQVGQRADVAQGAGLGDRLRVLRAAPVTARFTCCRAS